MYNDPLVGRYLSTGHGRWAAAGYYENVCMKVTTRTDAELRAVTLPTVQQELRRKAQDMADSMGIKVYVCDGRIWQHPPEGGGPSDEFKPARPWTPMGGVGVPTGAADPASD
jgi:hypothetical protein